MKPDNTYPSIAQESPRLLREPGAERVKTDGPEVTANRAIYQFSEDQYVTIAPDYSEVTSVADITTDNIKWKLLLGTTQNCTGPSVGPFETLSSAVEYIEQSLLN